jgi:hypothetical protein
MIFRSIMPSKYVPKLNVVRVKMVKLSEIWITGNIDMVASLMNP